MYNTLGGLKKIKKRRPRLNFQIRSPEVRVIDQDGKQIGVLPVAKALRKAKDLGLDLVEVAAEAKPPVVRILDFKKYRFTKKRQQSESKKKTKTTGTKELRFRPSIGPNDLQIRIDRAREFLSEGNKVKLTVQFRGRQVTHPEIGFEKINGMIKALADVSKVEQAPRKKHKFIHAVLGPN